MLGISHGDLRVTRSRRNPLPSTICGGWRSVMIKLAIASVMDLLSSAETWGN